MPGYGPDCTVAVVDACASELAAQPPRGDERTFSQLQHADVIVLNKLDVAGRDAAAKLQHSLGLIAPAARFVWTRHGRVAPSLLLGPAGHLDAADGPVVTAEWRPDYLPKDKRSSVSMLGEYCRSWQLVSKRPVAVKDFRNWVGRLATTILRASGVVFIEEDQTHRHEFSLIGSRWQLRRSSPWGEETPSTTITMVGISARDRVTRDSASVPFITSPTSLATPMGQVM
jgi:G3E family GTPase